MDSDARFLLKSGGHYWFSVWQTCVADIALTPSDHELPPGDAATPSFLRSPRAIRVGKWEKLRASGHGPSPRRHHSMTCMADAETEADNGSERVGTTVRRLLFFGGQSEGIPFEASNDLFLLSVEHPSAPPGSDSGSRKLMAHWLPTCVVGQPPSRRCGHVATLLSPDLLVISGGSDGTTPIQALEVHVLHIEGVAGE